MTERDDDVWNKMAVPTLDTLLEALIEVRRREKIEEWQKRRSAFEHPPCNLIATNQQEP